MFAVVHVPRFALQAVLRHEPMLWQRPVVLVDPGPGTPRVIEFNDAAHAAAVEPGLTAPQALARCPGMVVRHRSVSTEEAARAALIQAAHAFSPNLEWTAPGWVTVDLRGLSDPGAGAGLEKLTGWASRLAGALSAMGWVCRVGVGPTPGVARHAAAVPTPDGGGVRVVTAVEAPGFVSGLSVAVLGPSTHTAEMLSKWGIRTVGELLRLGQAELADRLGLEAFALWASASTTALRPLRHEQPPEEFVEEAPVDPPVEMLEPLLFLLRRFVDSLERRLEPVGRAAGELVLRLETEAGEPVERRLRIPEPTRRADVLFRILGTHLEGVRTAAAITGVRLEVLPSRPRQHQFTLFEAALRDPHQFQETLARLSALVGPDRVGSPVRRNGHKPDQFQMVPPDFESVPPSVGCRTPEILRPVPLRRFRPPQPAEVAALLDPLFRPAGGMASDPTVKDAVVVAFPGPVTTGPSDAVGGVGPEAVPGRPGTIRSAVAQGRITVAVGPWMSSGRWWESDAWQRVEWDISVRDRVPLRLVWDGKDWVVEGILD